MLIKNITIKNKQHFYRPNSHLECTNQNPGCEHCVWVKSAVFWGITQRRVVIVYQRFGTTYRSHPHGSRVESRTGIREATFCVSAPPTFLTLFWFFILLIYSFAFLIFTFGLFVIYLSSFILTFSSFTVTLFHICFSNCLSCLHSRYRQQFYVVCIHPSLTLVLPYWLSSHHTVCYPAALSRIYVIGFLSYSDSWPVRMGPIRCPKTLLNNYHTTPRNTPEDRRFHQRRGGSLKSLCVSIILPQMQTIRYKQQF
jgi:hypothetical protein